MKSDGHPKNGESRPRSAALDLGMGANPEPQANSARDEEGLCELLVEAQVITRAAYQEGLSQNKGKHEQVIDTLVRLGFLAPSVLVEFLAQHPGTMGFDASRYEIEPELVALMSAPTARKHQVYPLDRVGEILLVGAVHPLDATALAEIEADTGLRPRAVLCSPEDIAIALEACYPIENEQETVPTVEEDARGQRGKAKLYQVARLIRRIPSLPALPETVARFQQTMSDPSSSISDVEAILTMDPTMAAKILSVANSAAYGFQHRITDITLAVSLLGLRETYQIVLSVSIADFVQKLKHFDYRAFWLEAICCAAASRIVAKAHGKRNAQGVFAAGLLHDLGRAVLLELQPGLAEQLQPRLWGRELIAEEERLVGMGHPEAGYELACHWDLPAEIAEPMRYHHAPSRATRAEFHVAIVALANLMAYAPGATVEENQGIFDGFEDTLAFLHLDSETSEAMLDEYLSLREHALGSVDSYWLLKN